MFTYTTTILGIYEKLFRVTQTLKNCLQLMSHAKSLILNKSQLKLFLTRKWYAMSDAYLFLPPIYIRQQTTYLQCMI